MAPARSRAGVERTAAGAGGCPARAQARARAPAAPAAPAASPGRLPGGPRGPLGRSRPRGSGAGPAAASPGPPGLPEGRPAAEAAAPSTSGGGDRRVADDVFAGAAAPRVAFGASRLGPAASVVRRFVDCVNRRDLAAAAALLADDVLWEDLGDAVPYAGRAHAADLLERTWGAAGEGVTLVVDELSDGAEAAGATWHLEADGRPLPDARGGGFFRLDAGGKIAYARELREPAAKPGENAFGIMRAVVPLLQRVDTTRVTDKWTAPRRPAGAAEGAAARVVRAFYDLINRKRVAEAMEYFAEGCTYEDLNFPESYTGKAQVRELMEKSCDAIPAALQFVVDDISDGESAVGVCWHLELDGKPFPFSRGVSLYRVEDGQVVYARDLVEPSAKATKRLPAAAAAFDPQAALFAAAAAVYTAVLILSPPDLLVPGDGLFWIKQETLDEIAGSSYNFFFVAPALAQLGVALPLVPDPLPAYHPVNEALFNFVNAWSLMFLPVLLRDTRSEGMNKAGWWGVQMFLTNAVLMPFLAVRAGNRPTLARVEAAKAQDHRLLSKAFGIVGGLVGLASVGWFAFARPELGGDLGARLEYWGSYISTDRVAFAFCVDLCLYSLWQPYLLGQVEQSEGLRPDPWKFVPFFGMAKWLQTSSGLKLLK